MTTPAIAATGLRKSFGDKLVLDGIDLNVPEGKIFSLLGPNVRPAALVARSEICRKRVIHLANGYPQDLRRTIGVCLECRCTCPMTFTRRSSLEDCRPPSCFRKPSLQSFAGKPWTTKLVCT